MALSYFGDDVPVARLLKETPVLKDEDGNDVGSSGQQLALWALHAGYDVDFFCADFQIIDLSWANLSTQEQLVRMNQSRDTHIAPSLGKHFSRLYMDSYIELLTNGASLHIMPYISSALISERLTTGPIIACVNHAVLSNKGRTRNIALRESTPDDIHGTVSNHFIVITGIDTQGRFTFADPWNEPSFHAIEPDHLTCAISAAQIECDAIAFQLSK